MRKRRLKTRTDNKVWNAVIHGMRRAFALYSPKYKAVRDAAKVQYPRYLQDGTLSKRSEVWERCASCNELFKSLEVDHKISVIPVDSSSKELGLEEVFRRLDCDIENLWAICNTCHKQKTKEERALRTAAKRAKKESA